MKTINPRDLKLMLESRRPVEILDVRPLQQFERTHIDGAYSLPAEQMSVDAVLNSRKLVATEPLYLVSESDALAQLCARALERQGLDNLFVVSGGMRAWQNEADQSCAFRP